MSTWGLSPKTLWREPKNRLVTIPKLLLGLKFSRIRSESSKAAASSASLRSIAPYTVNQRSFISDWEVLRRTWSPGQLTGSTTMNRWFLHGQLFRQPSVFFSREYFRHNSHTTYFFGNAAVQNGYAAFTKLSTIIPILANRQSSADIKVGCEASPVAVLWASEK